MNLLGPIGSVVQWVHCVQTPRGSMGQLGSMSLMDLLGQTVPLDVQLI